MEEEEEQLLWEHFSGLWPWIRWSLEEKQWSNSAGTESRWRSESRWSLLKSPNSAKVVVVGLPKEAEEDFARRPVVLERWSLGQGIHARAPSVEEQGARTGAVSVGLVEERTVDV